MEAIGSRAGADDLQRVAVDQQRRERHRLDQRGPELLTALGFGASDIHVRMQAFEDGAQIFGGHRAGEHQDRKHLQQHRVVGGRRVEAGEGRGRSLLAQNGRER